MDDITSATEGGLLVHVTVPWQVSMASVCDTNIIQQKLPIYIITHWILSCHGNLTVSGVSHNKLGVTKGGNGSPIVGNLRCLSADCMAPNQLGCDR